MEELYSRTFESAAASESALVTVHRVLSGVKILIIDYQDGRRACVEMSPGEAEKLGLVLTQKS